MRAGDGGARVVEPRPRPLDEAAVDPVQALDLAVLVGDEGGPVERRPGGGRPGCTTRGGRRSARPVPAARVVTPVPPPAEAGRVLEVFREMGGVDEELLRDAPHVYASPTEKALLRHRDPRAVAGRNARRAGPSRARADDEKVVVEAAHRRRLLHHLLDTCRDPRDAPAPAHCRPTANPARDRAPRLLGTGFWHSTRPATAASASDPRGERRVGSRPGPIRPGLGVSGTSQAGRTGKNVR